MTGLRGVTGQQGVTGLQGTGGQPGATGLRGATGLQGVGVPGTTGLQGPTGLRGLTGVQGTTGLAGPSVLTPQLILELVNYLNSNSDLNLMNAGQPQNLLVSAIANAAAYRFVVGLYRYLVERKPDAIIGNGVMDDILRGTLRWQMGLGGDSEIYQVYADWSANFIAAYNGKPSQTATQELQESPDEGTSEDEK